MVGDMILHAGDEDPRELFARSKTLQTKDLGMKAGQTADTSCAVCLADFKKKEKVKVLGCHHAFHGECLKTWGRQQCPFCLRPLSDEEVQQIQKGKGLAAWKPVEVKAQTKKK